MEGLVEASTTSSGKVSLVTSGESGCKLVLHPLLGRGAGV